jgi:hypothetical protein
MENGNIKRLEMMTGKRAEHLFVLVLNLLRPFKILFAWHLVEKIKYRFFPLTHANKSIPLHDLLPFYSESCGIKT